MDILSVLMFVGVGLAAAHVAHKTSEGEFALPIALVLGLAGALVGGVGASAAGMKFYELLGTMVVALGCATLCLLIWRQIHS
jgi:uncharacterized membrane protein YeaQ/YmgE (transglycosylase-associated protein family)